MGEMKDLIKKKDVNIAAHSHKDVSLKIMNIKIEELNIFYLNLIKKLNRQYEKEKDAYTRQFSAIGEYVKDSFIKDPNMTLMRMDSKCRSGVIVRQRQRDD